MSGVKICGGRGRRGEYAVYLSGTKNKKRIDLYYLGEIYELDAFPLISRAIDTLDRKIDLWEMRGEHNERPKIVPKGNKRQRRTDDEGG